MYVYIQEDYIYLCTYAIISIHTFEEKAKRSPFWENDKQTNLFPNIMLDMMAGIGMYYVCTYKALSKINGSHPSP